MPQGLTLQQLQEMGATPVQPGQNLPMVQGSTPQANPSAQGLTADQLMQMGAQPIQPQAQTQGPSIGGFLGNVVSSGANAIGGIANAIMHPIDTVSGLANTAAGGLEAGIQAGADVLGIPNNHIQTPEQQQFHNVINFFAQRYGGSNPEEVISHIAQTAYKDPVGFAMDLSALLGGAGAVAGKVGEFVDAAKTSSLLANNATLADAAPSLPTKAASGLGSAASLTDPFHLAGTALSTVTAPVRDLLTKLPTQLYDSAIGTTQKILEKGKSPAAFMADEGLVGTTKSLYRQVSTNRDAVEALIDDKLASTPGGVRTSDIIARATDDLMHQTPGAYTTAQIEDAIMKAPVAGLWDSDLLTWTNANTLRKSIDKILGNQYFISDTTATLNKLATEAVANALRNTIKAGTNTTLEFSALSKYITAQKLLSRQLAIAQKAGINIGMKDLLAGSIGATIGGVPGALIGEAAKRTAESSLAKTGLAQVIKKTTTVAGKVADSKAAALATNPALRQAAFQANKASKK